MNTALVIGSTGLVGTALIRKLLQDDRFTGVLSFSRSLLPLSDPRLVQHQVDFDKVGDWAHLLQGNILFSCMGSTLRKAGGKEAQYKIDFTYQFEVARHAAANGVPVYVLVSAAYASKDSSIFYNRMKGELEVSVRELPFRHIHIIRPGILKGPRKEQRLGETFGIMIANVLGWIPGLKRFRPIHANTVAQAMINAAFDYQGPFMVYQLEQVFTLAKDT